MIRFLLEGLVAILMMILFSGVYLWMPVAAPRTH